MEKFLNIAVTSEQSQLVSIKDVVLVEQATALTTTITYHGGKVVTLTHATVGASNEDMRDEVEVQIKNALATTWDRVVIDYTPSFAVSGIAVA
jgi:hypothetical protein